MRAWRDELMDAIFLQVLNGLDKGGAYALIALGLTLVFGTLGSGQFCAWGPVHVGCVLRGGASTYVLSVLRTHKRGQAGLSRKSAERTDFPTWWTGSAKTPPPFFRTIPFRCRSYWPHCLWRLSGIVMERGLIKHFYKRPPCRPNSRDPSASPS